MPAADTSRLLLKVSPNAAITAVTGWHGEALRVRTVAPPVNGKANSAVEKILAETLTVPRDSVKIVRGHGSRDKVAEVRGLDTQEMRDRLNRAIGGAETAG